MSTPETTPVQTGRFARLRVATDRVPTKWFAGILTGLFLAVTAAFGGLETAAAPPVATLALEAEHTTEQLTIQVQEAVVIEALPEFALEAAAGTRYLAVLAYVTNEWTRPLSANPANTNSGIGDILRVRHDRIPDAAPDVIGHVGDSRASPVLQPGIRTPLAFIWEVPSGVLEEGDEVEVQVFDETLVTGRVVTADVWWDDPTLAATVTATITDLGEGSGG